MDAGAFEYRIYAVFGLEAMFDHLELQLAHCADGILHHHEWYDGSGYPNGLKGGKIPLEARIAAVADQYDALRNARAYKPAFSHEKTHEIIVKGDGRTKPEHCDPAVLSVFVACAPAFEEISNKFNDKAAGAKEQASAISD